MAPAAIACLSRRGSALNAFTGLIAAAGRWPCANMKPSKMSSMTTSAIRPTPSTMLDSLTSK